MSSLCNSFLAILIQRTIGFSSCLLEKPLQGMGESRRSAWPVRRGCWVTNLFTVETIFWKNQFLCQKYRLENACRLEEVAGCIVVQFEQAIEVDAGWTQNLLNLPLDVWGI